MSENLFSKVSTANWKGRKISKSSQERDIRRKILQEKNRYLAKKK
jgi:hypothetical protein